MPDTPLLRRHPVRKGDPGRGARDAPKKARRRRRHHETHALRRRVRRRVALMTSDHLGSHISAPVTPGELGLGTLGYGFGLGFAVRLRARHRGGSRIAGRLHLGRLCRHLFLGRSQGGTGGGVYEFGAEPDPRPLPPATAAAGLSGDRGLTWSVRTAEAELASAFRPPSPGTVAPPRLALTPSSRTAPVRSACAGSRWCRRRSRRAWRRAAGGRSGSR